MWNEIHLGWLGDQWRSRVKTVNFCVTWTIWNILVAERPFASQKGLCSNESAHYFYRTRLQFSSKSWWYLPRVRRICHWVLPQPASAAWGWGPVGTGYLSDPPRSTWFLEVHHSETATRNNMIKGLVHDSSEFLCSPDTGQFTAWHCQRYHWVLRQHGYWPVYCTTLPVVPLSP